uniref:Golgi SNAP receptor complex member 1 n=1 Tax=Leersia perrieri TaxID=77586 RepID=A0A0D9XDR5_9ORYZ
MEASSWDALRKQARRLEAQLDDQMIVYRKLVSMKSDGSENDIESDIERSLKQLQQVNSQMQTWVSSGGSEVLSHTLTRHMEILQDLTQEFYRLRSSLRVKQQHASLLDLRDFDREKFDVDTGDSADQALLREQAAISRSSGQMDHVISHAQATLGTLMSQRSTFGGITTKISNVSSRLPTINHILVSIRRKKSMDTIILSLVASVCAFLVLIYWLSKQCAYPFSRSMTSNTD